MMRQPVHDCILRFCRRARGRPAVSLAPVGLMLCCVLWLGLCSPRSAAAQEPRSRFVQDRFAIGFWVPPQTDENNEERYREIAAAGFNLVIGLCGGASPRPAAEQLEMCARHDLRAIVAPGSGPPEHWPDGPAVWGYLLADEPAADAFAGLRGRLDALHEARPGKLGFINLFPNYASPADLGTSNYDTYLARFVAEVGPAVLSVDHYPLFRPDSDGREGYRRNLAAMRRESLAAGVPFWNFFNAMPYGPHTDPTEAQLRWQVFTSIASGAQGVMYFCYWTPRGAQFPKGGAILTPDGRRTRHYDEATRINGVLRNLGPTLLRLTSTGVERIESEPGQPVAGQGLVRSLEDGDFLLGEFRHEDGRRAVMLVNQHFAYSGWPTVEFAADAASVVEVDPKTGREVPLRDDSPDLPGLQLSFDAGEGRLFLLPAE